MDEKDSRYKITELFMAKAGNDYSRCFYGTIYEVKTSTREQIIASKIKVNEGYIYSQGKDKDTLGGKLDELILMVLDFSLNDSSGVTSKIAETEFNHN